MFECARKKVEGPSHNIPYSEKKVQCLGTFLYWKSKVRQLKGIPVDEEELSKKKEIYLIDVPEDVTREMAKEQLTTAREQWHAIKEKGVELREKYLLDQYNGPTNTDDFDEKKKDKAIKSV